MFYKITGNSNLVYSNTLCSLSISRTKESMNGRNKRLIDWIKKRNIVIFSSSSKSFVSSCINGNRYPSVELVE